MKAFVALLGSMLSFLVPICNSQTQIPPLLLQQVTLIDPTGSPPRINVDVLIRDERIEKIGPHILTPRGALIVQGHGKFLIPGLWDMHVHIWDADLAFPLFLTNGVTGVRNMGSHPEELKRWRQELSAGQRVGPRLVACGPVVDGPPPIHPDHSVVVDTAAQARSAVDELKSQGWDFIKLYDNVTRDAYFAIAAEAKKDGIPFAGHVPLSVTAVDASDAGQKSIEHFEGIEYVISSIGDQFRLNRLERIGKPAQPGEMMELPLRIANEINQLADSYDESRAADLFARLLRNGTWQVPTLSVARVYASIGGAALYQDQRLKYVDRQERNAWEHNPIVHLDIPEYVAARKRAFQLAMRIATAAHRASTSSLPTMGN